MIIREASGSDCRTCAAIHFDARAGMAFLPDGLHSRTETETWMRDIVFADHEVLVAGDGPGTLLGYLSLNGDWVSNLYVRPDRQGRGIGAALLAAAKGRRQDGLRLWVFQANEAAIRFYRRHGFQTVRETDGRDNAESLPDLLMAWPN